MKRCLICGAEGEVLCEQCQSTKDRYELFCELEQYRVDPNQKNELWEELMLEQGYHFKEQNLYSLASEMESPLKEYGQMIAAAIGGYVKKDKREYYCRTYEKIKDNAGLTKEQHARLKGFLLHVRNCDYKYREAEQIAEDLAAYEVLDGKTCMFLADFYVKTRRYEKAKEYLDRAVKVITDPERFQYNNVSEDLQKRSAPDGREYVPSPKTAKEEYYAFLQEIGLDVKKPVTKKSKIDDKIPENEYPDLPERIRADFEDCVVFDLETSGLAHYHDIIEFGAVKIENGVIREEKTFSELVKPMKSQVEPDVEEKTGITQSMLKNKREIWDVFPDFAEFIGDSVLVGFNCISFDKRFLRRAGRHSKVIIRNELFDVMQYAKRLGYKGGSLDSLCEKFGIKNDNAHRALSDAVATAELFLKLKESDNGSEPDLDELLSGI